MAKSSRKKKLKNQDFQKVKLKVGKKLQPAQNATDTSFKSRSIFIPHQLNRQGSEPTNQRNQTLKDLLAQVGHYSVTSRQDALVGLKDLFQCHANLLHENLGVIIKRVAEKITDSEPSVRQSLLLLLCFIFPMVRQERMAPFSSLLIAHLSCAMTHIYDDIQHDSLGFLELCLRCFPSLMVASSNKLIHNFIGMISHQGALRTKTFTGFQLKARKGLSVNPSGKLSSLRSRLKVLQQLLAFLKAVESSSNYCSREGAFSLTSSVSHSVSSAKPVFTFSKLQPTQVQVLQHSVNEPKLPPVTFDSSSSLSSSSLRTDNECNILADEKQIKGLLEVIVPLLLECWIECNPAEITTGLPNSVVGSSAIDVMLAIAEILKVIFKAAHSCFQEVYVKDLNKHFMSFFPFPMSRIEAINKGKRKRGKSSQKSEEGEKHDNSAVVLNLTVCEIMLHFLTSNMTLQRNFQSSFEALEEFVVESLEMKAKGGEKAQMFQMEHVESLVVFAYKIIVQHCSFALQDPGRIQELLEATFILYQSSHIMSGTKRLLVSFFANLAFHDNPAVSRHEEVHRSLERWLQGLPGLLVQLKDNNADLTELVLGILKKAVMQSRMKQDDNLASNLSMFFAKGKVPFGNLAQSIQRSAVELLFHLQSVDSKLLQVIVSCCQDGDVDTAVIQYILQVLHYRSPCYRGFLSRPAAISLPLYLSALFSVAIGFSKHKLREYGDTAKLGNLYKLTEFKGCSFIVLEETEQVDQNAEESSTRPKGHTVQFWEDHRNKLQVVCQCYRQSRQCNILLQYMSSPLETFLEEFKVLPLIAAHSLLSLVKCLVELATDSDSSADSPSLSVQTLANLAQLSLVCLKHSTTLESCTENFGAGTSDVKRNLFDAVAELLLASHTVAKNVLSLFLGVLSDNSSESLRQDCAIMLTKILCCEARNALRQSPDVVQLIVSRLAGDSSSHQKQCFADLQYQFSLFEIEVGSN